MAGVAFAVEGDGVGFATESYAASALYTTLASLQGALRRIRRVSHSDPADRLFRDGPDPIAKPWLQIIYRGAPKRTTQTGDL